MSIIIDIVDASWVLLLLLLMMGAALTSDSSSLSREEMWSHTTLCACVCVCVCVCLCVCVCVCLCVHKKTKMKNKTKQNKTKNSSVHVLCVCVFACECYTCVHTHMYVPPSPSDPPPCSSHGAPVEAGSREPVPLAAQEGGAPQVRGRLRHALVINVAIIVVVVSVPTRCSCRRPLTKLRLASLKQNKTNKYTK